MKFTKFLSLIVFGIVAFDAKSACATSLTINATLTADNHYALYHGKGNSLSFVGRNELGAEGNPGTYNWSLPEKFTFNANTEEYLYVVAWSDDAVAQGLIGQFQYNGKTLLTNATDWQVSLGNFNLGDGDQVPNFSTLDNIAYQSIGYNLPNGSSPWGLISEISPRASWIWGQPMAPGSGAGEYMVFRTNLSTSASADVPEPATLLLVSGGVLAGMRRRKRIF